MKISDSDRDLVDKYIKLGIVTKLNDKWYQLGFNDLFSEKSKIEGCIKFCKKCEYEYWKRNKAINNFENGNKGN